MLFTLIRASIKTQTEYFTNFLFTMISNGLAMLADFFVIAIIFGGGTTKDGWNMYHIAVLYSVIQIGFGLFRTFGEGVHRFEELILSGGFDILLLRPAPTLLQVALRIVDLKRVGVVIQGLAVGLWGLAHLSVPLDRLIFYPLLMIASTLMSACVSTAIAAIAFWSGKNEDINIIGLYATRTAGSWPLTIYSSFIQKLITFVIPFATVGYYPVSYILGFTDHMGALLAPVIALAITIPAALRFWSLGVSRYTSTGT